MTELQYGLIGLGAAAVAAVFAYNKWQERAHRKVAERVLKTDHDDVLLAGRPPRREEPKVVEEADEPLEERREPVLRIEPAFDSDRDPELRSEDEEPVPVLADVPEPTPVPEPRPRKVPVIEPAAAAAPEPAEEAADDLPAPEVPAKLLDPRLDFIVAMELVDPVAGEPLLHSQREVLQRLSKPVVWVGFNERSRAWERISPEGSTTYRRLRIGLQLANRRGPLSPADLNLFVTAMQALADELLAVADMPSTQAVLDRAMDLDRFSADVDLQIGVNLVSRGTPFSGTKLRALAEAAGMVLGADGAFTRYDDEGLAQFSLLNMETAAFTPDSIKAVSTHGVTFLLDVPRADHADRVFGQMVDLAKRFAETLQGGLVDDNRQPLTDGHLDQIKREYVAKPLAAMAEYGIPAGSPQAQRLFS